MAGSSRLNLELTPDPASILPYDLIGGDREEFRPAEFVAMKILRLAKPLLSRRYRVVLHERIASVLLEAAVTAQPGEHIIESDAIVRETT